MQPGREENELRMRLRNHTRTRRGGQRLADAHDAACSSGGRPFDTGIPIKIKRWIAEVRVAIDELDHGKKRTALGAVLQVVLTERASINGSPRRSPE